MNYIIFLLLGITGVSLINAESSSIKLVDDDSPCFDKRLQEDFDKIFAKIEEKVKELEKEWNGIKAIDARYEIYQLGQRIRKSHKCSKAVRDLIYYAVIENNDLKKMKEIKDKIKANDDHYIKMEHVRSLLSERIYDAEQQQQNAK